MSIASGTRVVHLFLRTERELIKIIRECEGGKST